MLLKIRLRGSALPSLDIILHQVASERATLNTHAESLDTKAGVVLGLAGVRVGLGATAAASVSSALTFQIGLLAGVASAGMAAFAFTPRTYPVVAVLPLRAYLTATPEETQLRLLDAQIGMVLEAAALGGAQGARIEGAVALLASQLRWSSRVP